MNYRLAILTMLIAPGFARAATVGDTDRIIPLVQDGGGWSTQVTIVNLSTNPALTLTTFSTAKGYSEPWKVELKAAVGRVNRESVESPMAPKSMEVIETSGVPKDLTRGYAEVLLLTGDTISAFARLVRRENGEIVQSFTLPLSPANESKSVMTLDLTDPKTALEMIWISPTSSTTLEMTFRKSTGDLAFKYVLTFDGNSQIFVKPLELWPQLAEFRGTLEWIVSFPNADRYESRYLAATSIWTTGGQSVVAIPAMTLKADQRTISPYN